jgi:hypothetical protein
MLNGTAAQLFTPGTNLKGRVAGGDWIFLRPSIASAHMICLGLPTAAALPTFAAFSGMVQVIVAPRDVGAARAAASPFPHVTASGWSDGLCLAAADGTVDTLFVANAWGRRLLGDQQAQRELQRVLHAAAVVYMEQIGVPLINAAPRRWPFADAHRVRLSPLFGEARLASPEGDREMRGHAAQHAGHGGLVARIRGARVVRALAGRVRSRRRATPCGSHCQSPRVARPPRPGVAAVERYGIFAGAGAGPAGPPPQYLRGVAAAGGVPIDDYRWAFAASGDYASRKLLFHLRAPGQRATSYIAKMVRDPSFNSRLENEYRVLRHLADLPAVGEGRIPRAVFMGHHAGLAIVGESLLDGIPLAERSCLAPDCRYFHAAVSLLTQLAARRGPTADAEAAAAAVTRLYSRFCELYAPDLTERRFLEARIEAIHPLIATLPTVVQHGDAGIWNMLAQPDGGAALIDWESADVDGLPLWDLCYFLRTYAVAAHRARRGCHHLEALHELCLARSPFNDAAAKALQAYCERASVLPAAIDPLFYLCWMHRALKEATRLHPSRLDGAHYLAVLRLLIASRQQPPLRRLLCD